ncbi:hypothetical protein AJ79_07810 [Helicocarpus griseus UAMH5409]|uniref:DUF7779 domain-containing protein n=1 Tax=Helicocarpus griseus UAMH5409 TaxID=1447875 RepID=A0A2B7WZ80_9EURO|nr:hypothetical protein AJ79_07810 [Helicocarpus griseus UAMH5409]
MSPHKGSLGPEFQIGRLKELRRKEILILRSVKDADALSRRITELIRTHGGPIASNRARVDEVIELSKRVAEPINILPDGGTAKREMVWGMLTLVLESTRQDPQGLEFILKMYSDLLSKLPQHQSCLDLLPRSQPLRLVISDVYREYMDFGVRTVKTFGRGKISLWAKLTWKREQKAHTAALSRLSKLISRVDVELNRENDLLNKQRYDEILNAVRSGVRSTPADEQSIAFPAQSAAEDNTTAIPFSVPHLRNTGYCGRENYLSEIHDNLCPTPSNQDSLKIFALCGLGGTGKSQAALEYIYRHRLSYKAILWITCDAAIKVAQGFIDAAREIGLSIHDYSQAKEQVKNWLCKGKDWLLVFDNAGSPRDLDEYVPNSMGGSILLTSQDQQWLIEESLTAGTIVGPFEKSEGIELLQNIMLKSKRQISEEDAANIVEELGLLPLAVRQIGSYIAATGIDPMRFLTLYKDRSTASDIEAWAHGRPQSYPHTLMTVWKLAFENLPNTASSLLNMMCFLDPDGIPIELFNCETLRNVDTEIFGRQADIDNSLNDIRRFSLINQSSSGGDFSVHRLVRMYFLDRLETMELQRYFDDVVALLRTVFPRQSLFVEPLSGVWSRCEKWISHITSIHRTSIIFRNRLQLKEPFAQLLLDSATYLWERGLLDAGETLILFAEEICQAEAVDETLKSEVYAFRATFLVELGDLEGALGYFNKQAQNRRENISRIRAQNREPTIAEDIQLANAFNNLAGIYFALGDLQQAEIYNMLSLQIKEHWKYSADLKYLLSLSYSNIANIHGHQGHWEEASMFYEKALETSSNSTDTLKRALTYHNYGSMRLAQGQTEEALELLTSAYRLRSEKIPAHFDTANTLHMLASCQFLLGDLQSSRDRLNEAIEIFQNLPYPDPRRIARSKYKLSLVLEKLGDQTFALLRKQAYDILSKEVGQELTDVDEATFDSLVAHI